MITNNSLQVFVLSAHHTTAYITTTTVTQYHLELIAGLADYQEWPIGVTKQMTRKVSQPFSVKTRDELVQACVLIAGLISYIASKPRDDFGPQ